jgi:hypothetical protein
LDEFHHQCFFKIELASVFPEGGKPLKDVDRILFDASSVVTTLCGICPEKLPMENGEGLDLMINDIEIGSYGQRSVAGFSWIYGTGLALPRFSQAISAR